jgi:choline dehydrogenase-like flavoprotein
MPQVNASPKTYDVIVVGSGAGGGIAAHVLTLAGAKVCMLEAGANYNPATQSDMFKWNYNAPHRAAGSKEKPFGYYDATLVGGWQVPGEPYTSAPGSEFMWYRARMLGGRTNHYGRISLRMGPYDFKPYSRDGKGFDWPIGYQDLEPYYEKAEWEMGVSGDDSGNIFKAPRKKALPMPPLPPNREYQVLHPAAKRLGLHPFDIPMLRNSVPYNGRGPCMRCRWCVGFACEVNAKTGTQNTVIPKALATRNCELRSQCMVKEVLVDERGRARGVAYFDENDRLQEQTADLVVVSGSAVESARLLLNSKSKLFPNGLGNRYDWVGRNLLSHTYSGAAGIFDFDTYDDAGPGAQIAVCDYNHGNPGLVGGALLANEFIRLPYQHLGYAPSFIPNWGVAHKEWVRNGFNRTVVLMGPTQEMPVFDARVQADPKVKDYWGIPVGRLSGGKHPHTVEIARFIAGKAEDWLKEAGAVRTWRRQPPRGLSGGQHQAGTCRMGSDPKTSVVDKYCRIHDVDNVYVIDGSVHVTNGGFNPA